MKPAKLKPEPPSPAESLATALLRAVGANDFAGTLLNALAGALPASHCTVFALRNTGRVESISTASTIGETATLTALEYMRLGFDQQDSNMVWLAKRKPSSRTQFWIGQQFAEEVANEEYRRLCYAQTGIRERLSLLAVFPDGLRVAVSLYRNHSYPDYRSPDIEWLGQHAALIGAAVTRHIQVVKRPRVDELAWQRLVSALPARERQVISHVLAGLTTKEAAREMRIATTTALTYRYRAFQHLGVRSYRELIAVVGGSSAVAGHRRQLA